MIDYGHDSEQFVGTTTALILGGLMAGGAVGGAAIQANAANNAANKQQQAANNSLALQSQIYNNTRGDLAPYAALGVGAAGNLSKLLGLPPANNGITSPSQIAPGPQQSVASLAPNAYTYNPSSGVTTYNGYNPQTGQISGTPPVVLGPNGQFIVNPLTGQAQTQNASGFVVPNAGRGVLG